MERKVRQLDNDVQSIYDLLEGISTTQNQHGSRLDELGRSLATVSATQKRHGNRLDELDEKLDDVDQKLVTVTATQNRHGNRFDELDQKLDRVIDLLSGGKDAAE